MEWEPLNRTLNPRNRPFSTQVGHKIGHNLKNRKARFPIEKKVKYLILQENSDGSPGRIRTSDLTVNSRPLYRLSYRGAFGTLFAIDLANRNQERRTAVEQPYTRAPPAAEPPDSGVAPSMRIP